MWKTKGILKLIGKKQTNIDIAKKRQMTKNTSLENSTLKTKK